MFLFIFFLSNSETPVVEKEVVEVDAPKVVDEENEVVENGNGDVEETPSSESAAENGTAATEAPAEEVTSAEPEVEAEAQNGDSSGKF